jgi:CRP/FNR family transcriptional regulator, cyclic AMP receptor protein
VGGTLDRGRPPGRSADVRSGIGRKSVEQTAGLVDLTAARNEWLFEHLIDDVRAGKVRARERGFAKGEVVFHEEDPGDTIHLVVEGLFAVRASTSAGRDLIISILGAGNVFGEFAVFMSDHIRTSSVTALVAGKTIAVHREELRKALRVRPELVEDLVASVVVKAESTRDRLVELVSVPAELRVLRALLLVDGLDRAEEWIPVTQSDLASLAATTRPTANRVLREEEERGSVRLSRCRVTVMDAERLAKRAGIASAVYGGVS